MFDYETVKSGIELQDFLPVFILGALVIIFGAMYVGFFTLVKMGYLKKYFMYVAYFFWGALVYSLYTLSVLINCETFTKKVLMLAMLAYLIFPHFVYFLMEKSHDRYEQ